VLRIFGLKSGEVIGEWRTLHNGELNGLYASSNIFRGIKLRRIKWVGHVGRMGQRKGVYRVLVGILEKKETTWKT
jgi:hypothetical protein